jgi:hypothetical protein
VGILVINRLTTLVIWSTPSIVVPTAAIVRILSVVSPPISIIGSSVPIILGATSGGSLVNLIVVIVPPIVTILVVVI